MTAVTSIRADILKGLLLAAAKKDCRTHLCSIFFDTERDALVATNGHVLIAYKCSLPKDVKPFILTRQTAEQAIKLASKQNNTLVIHIDGTEGCRRIELHSTAGGMAMGPEDMSGTFPNWHRVVPTNVTMQAGQFDAAYLDLMQDAFCLILDSAKAYKPAVMHNGPDSAAMILAGGHPDLMGIVMPMRQGSESNFEEWRKAAYQSFGIDTSPPVSDEGLAEAA